MKKFILFILMLCCYFSGISQKKTYLDIDFRENEITNPQSSQIQGSRDIGPDYLILENDKTGFSLLPDAYFTIGTTNGFAGKSLDDNCQISFGHPYALTSYPFFSMDGSEHHPELYFDEANKQLFSLGDTLIGLQASDPGKIDFTFAMSQRNNGETIRLHLLLENMDNVSHNVGMGLQFDPALGLWGDGFAFINGELILTDTVLQNNIPSSFNVWERSSTPKGMGIEIEYIGNLPSALALGNWFDQHYDMIPVEGPICDLGIEMEWSEVLLNPGEELSFILDISIVNPEFPNGAFLRSDLPYFLSVENNLLFPREIKSMVKVANNGNTYISYAGLEFFGGDFIEDWNSTVDLNIPSHNTTYSYAMLDIPENYKEKVISMELNLMQGAQMLDQIRRNVFIPAAPFSDSGLIVTIDTIILSGFPTVELFFHSEIEESGQILKDLSSENVFFYEDTVKIENFILEKDTTGGVNQADIIFVLDVTGSMGNEIDQVKDNIVEFSDSLSAQGVDFRLGMVTFLDWIENIYDFTSNVQLFQSYVNEQYAHGGDDIPENSLDALMQACQFDFRPNANRIFIWITDADYHINNNITPLTPQEVVNEMLMHSIEPHCIGATQYQQNFYDPILFPTGGNFYDINGNFRDILLEISRLGSTGSYKISYLSNAVPGLSSEDIVEVHYAGLGGMDTIYFIPPTKLLKINDPASLRCYPNPFYSSASIVIDNPKGLKAKLEIYNTQGQRLTSRNFESGEKVLEYRWDARDDSGKTVSNGLYLVRCDLFDPDGRAVGLPVLKLIYLK